MISIYLLPDFSTPRKDEKHTSLVLTDIVVRTNHPNQLS